jgi:hypothetical protein
MRRKLVGTLVLAAAALTTASCAKPAGVDGNLTNGWPRMAEAKIEVPAAGACYTAPSGADPSEVTKWPAAVACDTSHNVETVHVGTFTGADADRSTPPPGGGPGRRKAYEECGEKAKEYLGDDWRLGRLQLFLVTPVALHWEAGARWFRCDLVEYKDLDEYEIVTRTASMKGGLGQGAPLRLGCLTITQSADKRIDKMTPVECTTSHNGEFAGVFNAPDGTYPADQTARETQNLNGCRGIVAAFAGIPDDSNFRYRTGQIASGFTKSDWELGNRGVRCYIWPGKNVTSSLKGVGPNGLPINYAN